jgi:hypothetical protein
LTQTILSELEMMPYDFSHITEEEFVYDLLRAQTLYVILKQSMLLCPVKNVHLP